MFALSLKHYKYFTSAVIFSNIYAFSGIYPDIPLLSGDFGVGDEKRAKVLSRIQGFNSGCR
jgi:hypothetical protein